LRASRRVITLRLGLQAYGHEYIDHNALIQYGIGWDLGNPFKLPIGCFDVLFVQSLPCSIRTPSPDKPFYHLDRKKNAIPLSKRVVLSAFVAAPEIELRTAILAAVEAVPGPDQQEPVPRATVSQIQALGLAQFAAVDILDVVLDGSCDGDLLRRGVAVLAVGVVSISDPVRTTSESSTALLVREILDLRGHIAGHMVQSGSDHHA
jgi:hypothetical protein